MFMAELIFDNGKMRPINCDIGLQAAIDDPGGSGRRARFSIDIAAFPGDESSDVDVKIEFMPNKRTANVEVRDGKIRRNPTYLVEAELNGSKLVLVFDATLTGGVVLELTLVVDLDDLEAEMTAKSNIPPDALEVKSYEKEGVVDQTVKHLENLGQKNSWPKR